MNQPSMPGGQTSLSSRPIPWPVWLLVLGAVAQLAVQIAPVSYHVFGPYLLVDAGMVVDWIHSVSLFLLAAAVVLAAHRWPTGRRTLLIGAAVLAISALARMGVDLWWVLWESNGAVWDPTSPWLSAAYLGGGLLFVIGHVILAAGLWTAAANGPMASGRIAAIAAIALGGAGATATALWAVTQAVGMMPSDSRAYAIAISALLAASFASLALLAIAAVRAARRSAGMPETLVAAGAVIVMSSSAWTYIYPNLVPLQEVSEQAFVWVFTLPRLAEVVGWLTMIAGFGLAAWTGRRAGAGDDPRT